MNLFILGLGGALCLVVTYLGVLFLFTPERGLEFSSHQRNSLTTVMANRYFSMAAIMIGSLIYGEPEVIAFVFIVTGLTPAHDAWIYARQGQPFTKHIPPAVLSAIVAAAALYVYFNTGAA